MPPSGVGGSSEAFRRLLIGFGSLTTNPRRASSATASAPEDARFSALLVIGRSAFLPQRERQRLNWRLDRILINSNKVSCLTFDDLYLDLRDQLASLSLLAK